jgi:DNA-binding MarR family transcriptional regulator
MTDGAEDGDVTQAQAMRLGAVRPAYLQTLALVERLHRRLLDVVKDEFARRGDHEVSAVQALLIYNVKDAELTAGELRERGYYLGVNVSHNMKKLVETGYVHRIRAGEGKRAVRFGLTEKGRAVHVVVAELYEKHMVVIERIGGVSGEELSALNQSLIRLERFWIDQIRFRL